MSETNEVLAIARRNFENVKRRKAAELAKARSREDVDAIEDNFEAALAAYLKAIVADPDTNAATWQNLLDEAKTAESELKDALDQAKDLAATAKAGAKLTGSITKLVKAATKLSAT